MSTSPESGQTTIGSDRLPTEVIVRDYQLRLVHTGVTPVTLDLPAGLYEIEMQSGPQTVQRIIRLRAARAFDATGFGLRLETTTPVSAAHDRHQVVAEAATKLSSRLHQSRQDCGLVLVLMHGEGHPAESATRVRVLDSRLETVSAFEQLQTGSEQPWSGQFSPLRPGGYVIQCETGANSRGHGPVGTDRNFRIQTPVWVSAGYQTLVFIPCTPDPQLDGMSVHMTRMREIWTGFDTAANALELALQGWSNGKYLLADMPDRKVLELAARNPVFGIFAAHILRRKTGYDDTLTALLACLRDTIPGHPDVAALDDKPARFRWPPSVALSYRRIILTEALSNEVEIVQGSLAEAASAHLLLLGPWTTWQRLDKTKVNIADTQPATGVFSLLTARPDFPSSFLSFVRTITSVRLYVLLHNVRMGDIRLFLRNRIFDEDMVDRVRIYLLSVLEVRGAKEFWKAMIGRSTRQVAAATSLPHSVARRAMTELVRSVGREYSLIGRRSRGYVVVQDFARVFASIASGEKAVNTQEPLTTLDQVIATAQTSGRLD